MKTEDFKAHLRSSERCGALHQMGELEAKIKSQEKQLEATKEELRMLREKYEKELLKSSNSPPSQETPSSEGEHDVLEDEAEAAREVIQGAVGETDEESAGSIELNKETKKAAGENAAANRVEASRREEKIQDEEGELEEDLDNPSDDSEEGVSNSRSPSATPSRSSSMSRSWSRSRSRSGSWDDNSAYDVSRSRSRSRSWDDNTFDDPSSLASSCLTTSFGRARGGGGGGGGATNSAPGEVSPDLPTAPTGPLVLTEEDGDEGEMEDRTHTRGKQVMKCALFSVGKIIKYFVFQAARLDKHILTNHPAIRKKDISVKNFSRHVREKNGRTKKACPHCEKTFSTKSSLIRHIRKVHNDERTKCPYCEKEVKTFELNQHINRVHKKQKEPCPHCEKEFAGMSNLHEHIKSVHKKKKVPCPHCAKEYGFRSGLNEHINGVHKKLKRLCPHCEKEFSSRGNLNKHRKEPTRNRKCLVLTVRRSSHFVAA